MYYMHAIVNNRDRAENIMIKINPDNYCNSGERYNRMKFNVAASFIK